MLQQKADTKCLGTLFGYRSPVGMSRGHGAIQLRSPEMGDQADQILRNQSTDDGTVASKRLGIQRHRNKQNLDYVLKSGLCGGLAGCAVWRILDHCKIGLCSLTVLVGQNSRWTPRSCQDPFSGFQPSIRQIHRFMVRRRDRHAGHP